MGNNSGGFSENHSLIISIHNVKKNRTSMNHYFCRSTKLHSLSETFCALNTRLFNHKSEGRTFVKIYLIQNYFEKLNESSELP